MAPSAFATASLDDCGLDQDMLKTFCALNKAGNEEDQSDRIVRDLVYSNGGYVANSRSKIDI